MVIKLTGADFSSNNIGKLNLLATLSSETKALLANYSRRLTSEQNYAVQDFIQGLKDNGIWTKIGNLYLPVLAGNLSEVLYNVKTGTMDGSLNTNGYVLQNNGLNVKPETSSKDTLALSTLVNYNGSQQNLHALFYNTTEITATADNKDFLTGTDANGFAIYSVSNTSFTVKTDGNIDVIPTSKMLAKTTPSLKGIVQSTGGNMAVGSDNPTIGGTPISTDNTYTNAKFKILGLPSAFRRNTADYGLISLGYALTETEAAKYSELSDEFMRKLGVEVI